MSIVKTTCLFFLALLLAGAGFCDPIKFAFISDTHIGAPETAAEDLMRTVDDVNSLNDIAFVVITGDITDYGSDEELQEAKCIFDRLNKKWYIIPGNHDTKWSESGSNSFAEVFGAERFAFEAGGYWFVGCGSGPNMRMSPGLASREDVLWLDSTINQLKKTGQPLIFLNHYPLNEGLANWHLIIDKLKQANIQAALCGHGHRNKAMDFEGIPAAMGRSNLRAKDSAGGYNIVTIQQDTLSFAERTPGGPTHPAWHTIALQNHRFAQDTTTYPRPSYSINDVYPGVKVEWQYQDSSDIGAGIVESKGLCIYPNTKGQVVAVSAESGQVQWRFATGGKIYATPAVRKNKVVVASTDGSIYCLDKRRGKLLWEVKTGKPIVASPAIDGKVVYIGSSEGKFRALSLADGALRWEYTQVDGFVESTPVADRERVYFGGWGSHFYALDKKTGELAWSWTNGKGRNYSPAACVPVLAKGKLFMQTPDRFVTALDAATGKELGKSNKHKGFESMGVSEDNSLIYVKCMQDTVWALSTSDVMQEAWAVNCGYGYEISPSPITEHQGLVFVPTDEGVLYAIDRKTRKVAWAHKLSNAMVNRVFPLRDGQVLATTMDGKVAKLSFKPKSNK